MQLSGPERYRLTFDSDKNTYSSTPKFAGIATSKKPKLYVFSFDGKPVYVGTTKTRLSARFYTGWKATGKHGYHGYALRNALTNAVLDVWCQEDAPRERPMLEIETVEAEVVFLIRFAGQWPQYQTEIHFHESNESHRTAAVAIMRTYDKAKPGP